MKPKIICLCGSTKFKKEYEEANKLYTLRGYIVLSVSFFEHCERTPIDKVTKRNLDILHFRKIDLADVVLILNVDDYIGESTQRELAYAKEKGKQIIFWEKP